MDDELPSGYLEKKGAQGIWQKRFFILHAFELRYYDDDTAQRERGALQLPGCKVKAEKDVRKRAVFPYVFSISGKHLKRKYVLAAVSDAERSRWIRLIENAKPGEVRISRDVERMIRESVRRDNQRLYSPRAERPSREREEERSSQYTEVEEVEEVEEREELELNSDEEGEPEDVQLLDAGEEDQLKFTVLPLACLAEAGDGREPECISVVVAGEKLLACGTQRGAMHIVDVEGSTIREYTAHELPITCIAMDAREDYVAACSASKVSICCVATSDRPATFSLEKKANALALSPSFSSDPGRPILIGDSGGLTLRKRSSRGWDQSQAIRGASGQVHAVKWKGDLVVFADGGGDGSGIKLLEMT
eukprot:Hpha_TRINITY_DN26453_c0_g1::TRINITY_DN26453_c0_g1_i1::g.33885::m.33885